MKPDIAKIVKLPAIKAAPKLLGCYLIRYTPAGIIKVRIVETEAYHQQDPASHSYKGNTKRTWPMFEAGGRLYVYFTYGMHHCLNIVVGQKGEGEAVLIRAAEPIQGLGLMRANRKVTDTRSLTNGPGKLTQALGIFETSLSGKILNKSSIIVESGDPIGKPNIIAAPRIGIKQSVDLPLRFYIRNNPYVSKL